MTHPKPVLEKSQKTSAPKNARSLLFDCFWQVVSAKKNQRALLDDLLSGAFEQHHLPETDRRWMTHFAYTLCRYWYALDASVQKYCSNPKQKLDPKAALIIKMGLLELSNLIATPPHAAINEAMTLSKEKHCLKSTQQFIHAVLQAQHKDGETIIRQEAVFPQWLQAHLSKRIGKTALQHCLETFLTPRDGSSIRVNTLKTSVETFTACLKASEMDYSAANPAHPEALYLPNTTRVQSIPGYSDGFFTPQNQSAMHVGWLAAPQAGERILEIGSAPGGKTSHLAALAKNQCVITALDVNSKRLKHLEANLSRLGVENVRTLSLDITTDSPAHLQNLPEAFQPPYDTIIIDAPCTATGVMRQHPDILLQLTRHDATQNAKRQRAILKQAWPLLKPGGKLIYATCSIDPVENEDVIAAFLDSHPKDKTLASQQHFNLNLATPEQDGFFIAVLEKFQKAV